MTSGEIEGYLTLADVAVELGVSRDEARLWIRRAGLVGTIYRPDDREFLVSRVAFEGRQRQQ